MDNEKVNSNFLKNWTILGKNNSKCLKKAICFRFLPTVH